MPDTTIRARRRAVPAAVVATSALALALACALAGIGTDLPSAHAEAPTGDVVRSARVQLTELQRRLDGITAVKRPTYRRTVELERRIGGIRRMIGRELAAVKAATRGEDAAFRAAALRWTWLGLAPQDRRLGGLRGALDRALGRMASLHDRAIAVLRTAHDVVERTWGALGGSSAAWSRVWPIRVRSGPGLRTCPVAGPWSLTDTFGAPRPGGRTHAGVDVIAAWGTPLVAAHAGTAVRVPNDLGGRAVIVDGPDGSTYYAHLSGYGQTGRVRPGSVIGFVGNSGNARGRIHHVHFEWRPDGGGASANPYRTLLDLCPAAQDLPQ